MIEAKGCVGASTRFDGHTDITLGRSGVSAGVTGKCDRVIRPVGQVGAIEWKRLAASVGLTATALVLVACSTSPTTAGAASPSVTASDTPSPSSGAVSGAAGLLASAHPLHAHLGGDGTSVLCDTDNATAESNGQHGVRLVVNFPGSANLHASILSDDGRSQNLEYTEGKQERGHVFDFPGFSLAHLQTLDVNATNQDGSGTCWVVDNLH